MEVLTKSGWKRWDECSFMEWFAVPDPDKGCIQYEYLCTKRFVYDGDMYRFENARMSFRVTDLHTMYFKGKYQKSFKKSPIKDLPKWGHFFNGSLLKMEDNPKIGNEDLFKFIGFALGDGCFVSRHRILFHLKKDRKLNYLHDLCKSIGLSVKEKPSETCEDAYVIYVDTTVIDTELELWLGDKYWNQRAHTKALCTERISDLQKSQMEALLDGMINSDGSIKIDREQIQYSSKSSKLLDLFEFLSINIKGDAHRTSSANVSSLYLGKRTTLEARKQYFSVMPYIGNVYCTSTSNGLLLVRGGSDKFSFVCGNSTPMEMCELKLHIKLPMHIWRQVIRHRTASVNEISTRYSLVEDDKFEHFQPEMIRIQSKNNKQGSEGLLQDIDLVQAQKLAQDSNNVMRQSYEVYSDMIESGVAREQARNVLPLSTYTEAYWKMDLHNLFHFLQLRLDLHAQKEIRDFAEAIYSIVVEWVPISAKAFSDYKLNSIQLSCQERRILSEILSQYDISHDTIKNIAQRHLKGGEMKEFLVKMDNLSQDN